MKKINKNSIKIIIGVILGVIAAIIVIIFIKNTFTNKCETYSDNGFTITMDEGFYKKDSETATIYYESIDVTLTGVKEYYENLESFDITKDSPLDEYAKLVSYANLKDYDYKNLNDKMLYYTYEETVNDKGYFYMEAITKGSDSFWLITLFCEQKNKEEYIPKFEKWLNTIEVE